MFDTGEDMQSHDPNAAALPGSGIFGLPHAPEQARVVLVPVPCEATTSYGAGTARGPAAILAASRQVDLFDVEVGRPYEAGIAMLPESAEVQAWNAEARQAALRVHAIGGRVDGDPETRRALERVNELSGRIHAHVHETVERWLRAGKIVGVVGGDHSVSYGAIEVIAARHPGLGILHVDAHADLRREYEGFEWSHASIMENVMHRIPQVGRLVQVGIRDLCEEESERIATSAGRIRTWYDIELARQRFEGATWAEQVGRIVKDLPGEVYVSFDIDGLDPQFCPHTGTPVPGGLSFHEAGYLVGAVARSGRTIVGFDLTEVAPDPGGSEWDANVGARLLYKLIGWTLWSRGMSRGGLESMSRTPGAATSGGDHAVES